MFDKLLSQSVNAQSDPAVVPLQPFPEDSSEHYFTGDASRIQRLNLLVHLVPYGGVLLILGESGVGKSALLQQLQMQSSDSCRICQLSTAACIDPRQALSEMLSCFAWQADADRSLGGAQLRVLREHLGILRRNSYAPVLLIDDAEALSDTVFSVLGQLFDGDGSDLLTLVLAGGAGLKKRLSSPLLQSLNSHVTHELELQAFSAEEQADYIFQHLTWAGIEGVGPFKASALKFIYVASRGIPRRINELARVFWENKKGGGEAAAGVSSWLQRPWLRQLRYVLPLVLISSAAAVFHNEIRTAIFPSSASLDEMEETPVAMLSKPLALPVEHGRDRSEKARVISEPIAPRPLKPSPVTAKRPIELASELISGAELKTMTVTTPDEQSEFESVRVVSVAGDDIQHPDSELLQPSRPDVVAVSDKAGVDLSLLSGRAIEKTNKRTERQVPAVAIDSVLRINEVSLPQAVVQAPAESPASKQAERDQQKTTEISVAARSVVRKAVTANVSTMTSSTGGRDKTGLSDDARREDDWWLAQPSGQFAVQLLAMEERSVKAYIKRHALINKVATFQVQGGEQGLLAAALGPFATQAEARSVAQQWRQQLPGIKPWVRSVASIQQTVAEYRRQQQPRWLALVARHEQQLLQQLPQSYTVQLMAMDQKAVTAFVAKYDLADRVVYFRTRSGGQELYAALLGGFSSRQLALAAGHDIAREAEGVRPWVRSLASVQQVIRARRDRPR